MTGTAPQRPGIRLLGGLILASLLAGCNGDALPDDSLRTGIFSDSPVAGLAYATESMSGVTDADGRFLYRAGETVRFSLGSIALGEPVTARELLTPLDIIPGARAFTTVPEVRAAYQQHDEAFFTLTNMLVLLQTFDDDGNAERISLSADVAELLADAQLDFAVDPAAFQQNDSLRYFAWRAASAGLIPTASPRQPGAALDHFYAAQNLPQQFRVPQIISHDYGNDGIADGLEEFRLNSRGSTSQWNFQKQTSGLLLDSAFEQWIVNTNGDDIWHTADVLDDAEPALVWSTNYDAVGMASEITVPGSAGTQSTTTITRDADGTETLRLDQNADGFIDRVTIRRFDRGGRLRLETVDANLDGTPESTRSLSYDSAGVLAAERIESDDNADGNPDSIRETWHNSRGQPETSSIDYNGDGQTDQVETWTYDNNGRLLQHTGSNPVTNASLLLLHQEYDADGRITYRKTTSDFAYAWRYDADGYLIESSVSCTSCAATSVTTTRYRYDASARRTTLDSETRIGGELTETAVTIYEYDDAGALTRLLRDDAGDGSYELSMIYQNQPGDWSSVLDTRIDQPPSLTLPAYYGD